MLARLQALGTRPLLVALLIGLAAQLLFTFHLDQPSRILFDEVHYVPAAQALIDLEGPRNVEHPLLGKELIGAGIVALGDNPFGWRITATLAGTATVVGAFAFVWLLLGSMRAALVAAALAMLNQTLFVQARTAMLDVYLGAFVLWAMIVMLWAMRAPPGRVLGRWIGASALMGLAVAVKWAAIPYVALAALAFVAIRLRDARRAKRPLASAFSGKDQPHWPGLGVVPGLLILGAVSITVYFATFYPAFFYANQPLTWSSLLPQQFDMYALQTQKLRGHTYQSDWWSWPLMLRPIWYFYEWDRGAQRGVLLIGNPVIMWGGLVAVLACYWAWFRSRAAYPLAVALLWTASVALYAIIPKSLGFYYYYHLSGIFLCLVLAVAFHHFDRGRNKGREEWFAAAALIAFLYFYPILAASPLRDSQGFTHWMWFTSWR
ncbi:phospholipid carrier-dependent glycosyltransferase [Sphingomonas hengshuiensis]|uniref:Polyprenol-phosphate-mannose--protein mannosyltransferase n=1 Tax=Sphingomonas hengshuiensis TaxID=1609977 RepID=A0A7U4LE47_9SPHN|nr:phospholipid carrier-dependent glycosyltransferase [Sphingomonas hengshuiensis]AJP71067.1 dolichyl-phosphate-mannose-protein mannosyltransferase [Sphingomonas hengshuiensis]